MKIFVLLIPILLLTACASNMSPQQVMAEDRQLVYKDTYNAYIKAENKYLNLLFNIERMPEEEELWIMKRDQMKELLQLRDLMLQSRSELDLSVQDWEKYLKELRADTKKKQTLSPNFRGNNGKRSSPGQLLPYEAAQLPKAGSTTNEDVIIK